MPDQSGATQIWVSRGDNSGTNSKEKSLWTAAGYDYTEISNEIWFASTGQGMGATLTVADQKSAYTLSDIGTFLKFHTDGSIELDALILEEQYLLNVYSVMAVNPTVPTNPANQSVHEQINFNDAMDFIQYLVSPSTQQLINDFGKDTYGQPLFYQAVQPLKDNLPQPLVEWIKDYAFFEGSECPPQYRNGYENLYTWRNAVLADVIGDITEALQLIVTGDPEILGVVSRSLLFSGTAVILAILWGTPLAMLIAMKEFRGKTILKTFLSTLIGLPTVVLGLILFLIFSRGGPLGFLGLLYTPAAIIIGQAILITPILVSIGVSAIESVDPEIMNLSKTLGASESQAQVAVLKEALSGIVLSDIASFNRAIGELGVVLLVGGNIRGTGNRTDVMTTAISRNLQVSEIGLAIALGILLVIILFTINIIVVALRRANYLVELAKGPYSRLKRYRENKR